MSDLPHKNQVRWACRRGMLELDKFLFPFFDNCYDELPEAQQVAFVAMLNAGDQELYQWLLGTAQPDDAQWQQLCEAVRQYAQRNV